MLGSQPVLDRDADRVEVSDPGQRGLDVREPVAHDHAATMDVEEAGSARFVICSLKDRELNPGVVIPGNRLVAEGQIELGAQLVERRREAFDRLPRGPDHAGCDGGRQSERAQQVEPGGKLVVVGGTGHVGGGHSVMILH